MAIPADSMAPLIASAALYFFLRLLSENVVSYSLNEKFVLYSLTSNTHNDDIKEMNLIRPYDFILIILFALYLCMLS